MHSHLLSAGIANSISARTYYFQSERNRSKQINTDQSGAFITTGFVDFVYKNTVAQFANFMLATDTDQIITQIKGANLMAIITKDALDSFPCVLGSNEIEYCVQRITVGI